MVSERYAAKCMVFKRFTPLNSELKLTNKVKKGEFLSKYGQCLIFIFSPTEWLLVGWFFKPGIHGRSQNCREILEKTKRVKVILNFFYHFFQFLCIV